MIKSDSHVHTAFSTDSQSPMESMLLRGIELGFSSVCFTDHMDYDFPSETDEPEFLLDVESYFNELNRLSGKYTNIKIRKGIELGLKENVIEECKDIVKKYPFDFVICSTHLVDNMDPYNQKYWEYGEESERIRHYYETTLDNIKRGVDFDVYGHIDYIIRYTPYMKKVRAEGRIDEEYMMRHLSKSMDVIEEILRVLINNGKGIEINTGGFKYGLGHPNPNEKVLKLYRELGGEIITVGSDAHEPKHLGYDFNKVPQILSSCGFRYYTEFTGRKPDMVTV